MNEARVSRIVAAAVAALAVSVTVLGVLAAPFLLAPMPSDRTPTSTDVNSIIVRVSTDKPEYRAGETVYITATIHNGGPAPITQILYDSCGDRVSINDPNGTMVWIAMHGMACLQVIEKRSIAPGTTAVSHFEWDQTDLTGGPVPDNRSYQVVYYAALDEGRIRADVWIYLGPGD